jgi:hypothetical protein
MNHKTTYLKAKAVVKDVFVGRDEHTHCIVSNIWVDTPQSKGLLFGGIALDDPPKKGEHYRQLGRKGIDYLFRVCEIFGYEDNCNFNLLLEKECEVILKRAYSFTEYFEVVAIGNNGKWFNPDVYWGKEQYVLKGYSERSVIYEQLELGKEYELHKLGKYAEGITECALVEVENEHRS